MPTKTPTTTDPKPVRVPVAFRVPAPLKAEVIATAIALDETPTQFAERALAREVARHRRGVPTSPPVDAPAPRARTSRPKASDAPPPTQASPDAPLARREVTPMPKGGKK